MLVQNLATVTLSFHLLYALRCQMNGVICICIFFRSHEIFKDGIEVVRHLLDLRLLHHQVLLHLCLDICTFWKCILHIL